MSFTGKTVVITGPTGPVDGGSAIPRRALPPTVKKESV